MDIRKFFQKKEPHSGKSVRTNDPSIKDNVGSVFQYLYLLLDVHVVWLFAFWLKVH